MYSLVPGRNDMKIRTTNGMDTPRTVSNWYIYFLLLLRPVYELLRFFINFYTDKETNNLAYVQLFCFLLLFQKFKKSKFFIYIWLYFIFNIFFFYGDFNNNAGQVIIFVLFLVSFYYLPLIQIRPEEQKSFDRFILYFAYVYSFMFFSTVLFFKGTTFSTNLDRTYFNGFIIGHSFCYTIIIIGYYVAKRISIASAIPLFIFSLFSGTRVGFIVLLVTIGALYFQGKKINIRFIAVTASFIVIAFASLVVLRSYIEPLNDVMKTFDEFSFSQFSFDKSDVESVDFTASRTIIWANAVMEIMEYGPTTARFWFGGGPQSALDFNEITINARVWMHNDIIVLYLFVIVRYYRRTGSRYILGIITIAALTNGFYTYDILSMIIPITLYHNDQANRLQE